MKMMKHIQTWLLITLLALSANGVVNAKAVSGHQNLSSDLHQSQTVLNTLLHQGLEQVSTMLTSESPLATKSAGQRLADKAQSLPASQRPNTVAVIKHKDGTVTVGRNQGGVQNTEVQSALSKAPSNCFGGQCAEINALARARNKGRSLKGATIDVRNVRGSGSTSGLHGSVKQPCNTCSDVLGQFGVKGS
jgi:hypothetical protein